MLIARPRANDGYVELRLRDLPAPIYGAELTYATDDGVFHPCAIHPTDDVDQMLATTFWTWNQAVQFGRVKFAGKPAPVLWNLYRNALHKHRGTMRLRAQVLLETGVVQYETTAVLKPARAIYLDGWEIVVPPNTAWRATDGVLTAALVKDATTPVPPIRMPVGVTGRYAIHVGMRGGCFTGLLTLSTDARPYPFNVSSKHPELEDKVSKEIFWKEADLTADAYVEIAPTPAVIRDPIISKFGSIAYLKLVPVPKPKSSPVASAPDPRTLALYFEPFTWAYYYNLTSPAQVRAAIELYKEMGATEVHNQIIRFGCKALHHSKLVERFDTGTLVTDDGTSNDSPNVMVRSIDVLREAITACRDLGLPHHTNAGLTNCYPGSGFEERISREHPDWRTGNVLRYNRPETRAYAAAVMAEFVEWGTDGLSIDCMRYCDHHTEEDLVLLFREIRAAVAKAARGRQVPMLVRIPTGDPIYYRAFETLVKEGAIQTVVPSTVWPRENYTSVRPYLKWKDHGCRVLGIIDGWKTWVGTFCDNYQLELLLSPADIRADIQRHLADGADGIYVYQADCHCADPLTRPALKLPGARTVRRS